MLLDLGANFSKNLPWFFSPLYNFRLTNAFNGPEKFIVKKIPLGKYYRYILNNDTLAKSENYLKSGLSWFPKSIKPFILFSCRSTNIRSDSFVVGNDPNNVFKTYNTLSLPSN